MKQPLATSDKPQAAPTEREMWISRLSATAEDLADAARALEALWASWPRDGYSPHREYEEVHNLMMRTRDVAALLNMRANRERSCSRVAAGHGRDAA